MTKLNWRNILIAMIYLLFFLSCEKKANTLNPLNSEKVAVSYNINGFSVSVQQMNVKSNTLMNTSRNEISGTGGSGNTSSSITDYAKQIYLWVYQLDGKGNQIYYHGVKYDSIAIAQNNLTDSLPYGSYIIYGFAKNGIITFSMDHTLNQFNAPNVAGTAPILGITSIYRQMPADVDAYYDYFICKKTSFNINGTNNINIPLNFNRFGGKLSVNVKDAYQYPNLSFTVSTSFDNNYVINNYNFLGDSSTYIYIPNVGYQNKLVNGQISFIQNTVNKPFNVKITANGITKSIPNVICYPNRTTLIEGNFFDSATSNNKNSFNINLNGTWDSIPVKVSL